jgi:hypothetical protein
MTRCLRASGCTDPDGGCCKSNTSCAIVYTFWPPQVHRRCGLSRSAEDAVNSRESARLQGLRAGGHGGGPSSRFRPAEHPSVPEDESISGVLDCREPRRATPLGDLMHDREGVILADVGSGLDSSYRTIGVALTKSMREVGWPWPYRRTKLFRCGWSGAATRLHHHPQCATPSA